MFSGLKCLILFIPTKYMLSRGTYFDTYLINLQCNKSVSSNLICLFKKSMSIPELWIVVILLKREMTSLPYITCQPISTFFFKRIKINLTYPKSVLYFTDSSVLSKAGLQNQQHIGLIFRCVILVAGRLCSVVISLLYFYVLSMCVMFSL